MKLRSYLTNLSLIVAFAASAMSHAAAEQAWELRRDRHGIQVHTRLVSGSPCDAVRTTTKLDSVRLSALVALIEDAEACPDRCAESYLLERLSDTESLVYTHNDMPFPVKDREVLAHVTWTQDAQTLAVAMNSVATVDRMDEVSGRLRLKKAMASWHFTPLADGSVSISNAAHIDPGSPLPGWLTNRLLIEAPFETMKAFVAEVRNPKYQDAQLSFVQEPGQLMNSAE
ncbi:START domain-containing protein [Gammaproteobacteria bacterium]|nr:START domain-containing protein [Gammaproteobacteria bacterium]